MTDVYYPETIEDTEINSETVISSDITSDSSSSDTTKPSSISDSSNPTKRISFEVISTALNTKSRKILQKFEFTQSGALQIGAYENGVSGDVKISPAGIVARNSSGNTTFTLDGDTGDAVFAGTIQSGTLITGDVVVGDNSIRLDGENRRILIYDDNDIPFLVMGEY